MKKPVFAFLVILIASTVQAEYSGGSGTAEDPYKIANIDDLLAFAADTNDYDANIIMTADINLGSYTFTTAVIARDIDNASCYDFDGVAFTGTFDGAGHRVINMKIDTCGQGNDYLGLFGCIRYGNVKNLVVENVNITGGNESCFIGGLTGDSIAGFNNGGLSNCHSTGIVIGGENSDSIGGLAGYGNSIVNCSSAVNVIGGFASDNLGGLAGVGAGIVRECYSTGTVTGDHSGVLGGLVGLNPFYGISDCYSTGAVDGGGFSNCCGGLVGSGWWYDSDVINCYATGVVTGAQYLGGLAGDGYPATNSFFLNTSGPDNGIGTPLTNEEMKQQDSFTGWDFSETWGIEENQTRPFLRMTYSASDLNRDEIIDFYDFAILASHWLEGL